MFYSTLMVTYEFRINKISSKLKKDFIIKIIIATTSFHNIIIIKLHHCTHIFKWVRGIVVLSIRTFSGALFLKVICKYVLSLF